MKVPFIDLGRQHEPIKKELIQAFERVFATNQFVLGNEVSQLETAIAAYTGTRYAIGVSNCTNALMLSLKALDITAGDEVITTPFTFVASAEVIAILGAKPVFCDIDPRTFNIDADKIRKAISRKTKAIIPVHLYGQSADMNKIMQSANDHKLHVIEDMAQAIGATYKGKKVGSFGDTACLSFFPTKNLNALGDAGMILTNNEILDRKLRGYRVHGAVKKYQHEFLGFNDRLDEIQAAFLRVKFKYLDKWNERHRQIANQYNKELKDVVAIPYLEPDNVSIYHQYTIRTPRRDELSQYLKERSIATAIHYPLPLHLQPVFKYLGYKPGAFPEAEKAAKEVLCLPINHILTDEEVAYVIAAIQQFFKK